jgi:hypothetical protein
LVGGGITNNFTEYLNLLDGPLVWRGTPDGVTRLAVVWLALLVGLAVAAVTSKQYRSVSLYFVIVSAFLALPYATGADVAAPRFMLPALALLCAVAGVGVVRLRSRWLRSLTFVAVLGVGVLWNLPVYHGMTDAHFRSGERVRTLGQALVSASDGEECFFLSPGGHPQISVASGCDGFRLTGDSSEDTPRFDRAAERGLAVMALVPADLLERFLQTPWSCQPVDGLKPTDWQVCKRLG